MSTPAARRNASPYARRLARERGLALDGLTGSGPNGRITAADISTFAAPVAPVAATEFVTEPVAAPTPVAVAPPRPVRLVGAFQAVVDLKPLAALIAASESGLAIDPFLVKAAARAAGPHGAAIRFADPAGATGLVADAAGLSPSEIVGRHAAAEGPATMDVVILAGAGIRPVAAGLADDVVLKLVAVADKEDAGLLLVHDEAAIPAPEAVRILAGFRALIESPLRLLV